MVVLRIALFVLVIWLSGWSIVILCHMPLAYARGKECGQANVGPARLPATARRRYAP